MPDSISTLMTKSWTQEDVTQAHESDCEVEESGLVKCNLLKLYFFVLLRL